MVQRARRQERLVDEGRALARAGLRGRHPEAADALVGPVPEDAVEPLQGFDV